MQQATRDALKTHLGKLKAGDKQQDDVPTICCTHPSILVSLPHPPTIPIPIFLPSLPLLSNYPAPRHQAHHQPRQHPCPRSSPRLCADLAEELIDFAKRFKHWRVRLGFTQREAALAINCSQTTISHFENLYLSFKSMRKMKPQLWTWMDEEQSKVISAQKP